MSARLSDPRLKILMVTMLVGLAAGLWSLRLLGDRGADPDALRDTRGVDVTILSTNREQGRYNINCRVTNRTARTAEQVVLTARLIDTDGAIVAINPLVGVSDLAPASSRTVSIVLPADGIRTILQADVECTLVRWGTSN